MVPQTSLGTLELENHPVIQVAMEVHAQRPQHVHPVVLNYSQVLLWLLGTAIPGSVVWTWVRQTCMRPRPASDQLYS